MSKGVKEIDRGEPLGLNPVDFCATCTRVATLQAKVYVYEKIIANSNFAPMIQDKPKEERKSRWVVRKPMTDGKDYEVQCEICGDTAAMIVGANSYEEALERFQLWLKYDEGEIFTRCCSSCGARMEVRK